MCLAFRAEYAEQSDYFRLVLPDGFPKNNALFMLFVIVWIPNVTTMKHSSGD